MSCDHDTIILESSPYASSVGFRRSAAVQRLAAATTSGSSKNLTHTDNISPSTFPGPLLLPEDDLANDPRYPPQSLRSWIRSKDRNEVTSKQNIVYVVAPPSLGADVQFMQAWGQLNHPINSRDLLPPGVDVVMEYLSAFYEGMTVKLLSPLPLRFESWDTGPPKLGKSKSPKPTVPRHIGLNIGTECVGIRSRPSPDGVFPAQLNLDDLLDAAVSILPDDAYSLILIVNQDLFEDDDDVFVCGRAYGGSRVAVISTARYNPNLDATESANINREHAWPASHCEAYIQSCLSDHFASRPKKKSKTDKALTTHHHSDSPSPMHSALASYKNAPAPESSLSTLSGLWLGRVCRTASHELGHCFGIDHCVYYACVMQSSSSLSEDTRQPPYLCPVDLAKVLRASGTTAEVRYRALLSFCERHSDAQMFAAFAGWIRAHLLCK